MSDDKYFHSFEISPSRTLISGYIEEINTALDNINNLELFTCWSQFSTQSTSTTTPTLKNKIEFLQSKIPNIKNSLNSYIEYLSDAQKKYKELSEDILEDINAIINKE